MAPLPLVPCPCVAVRCMQVSYSRFITGLQQENIKLNRKVLSELAMNEPFSFKALVDQVRFMRGPSPRAPPAGGGTEAKEGSTSG